MSGLSLFQLVDVSIHFSLALVWACVAQSGWQFRRTRQPQSRFFRMLPFVASTVAGTYGVFTATILIPPELRQSEAGPIALLFGLHDCAIFFVVALARHMAWFFPTPEQPPPRVRWLAVNYGMVIVMSALALVYLGIVHVPVIPPRFSSYPVLRVVSQLIPLGLILWRLAAVARPGLWGPGGGSWVARRADVVFLGGALVSLTSWLMVATTLAWESKPLQWESSVRGIVADGLAGVGFVVPLAVRALGGVVRGFLTITLMLAATGAIYFGFGELGEFTSPEFRPLLEVATVVALVCVLVPGRSWVRIAVDHVVFRRARRRREELQNFLHSLSPDEGVPACCQRALPEVGRVMRLRGAAMLLRDGATAVHGEIAFGPLERLWRSGSAAADFPAHALVGYELRALPDVILESLSDTNVVGVIPIISPRRQWGLLLISTGLLGATFSDEDEQVLQAFADQFALVLDGAELLARAVAMERSLAHSEKLAAIGELAARVAHEIRNPVTAARSLAQQLTREPTSPLNAEHAGLILSELERVERQVAALLRFARREEFHFEPVDIGALTRATVDALRPRAETAGIAVQVTVADGVVARADPEKMRQALINLVENAIDALDGAPGQRRLAVTVTSTNGTATLRVTDSGPGVAPDLLQKLFEPFFSLKPKGTGLGLAIAKRTVEAHGGRIEAVPAHGGMTFRIDLPLVSAE